jgi:hypothetical protein
MTAPQTAQSAAYTAFLLLITQSEAIARKNPAFFRYTEMLRASMARVQIVNAASMQTTVGTTEDKAKSKTQLYDDMTILTNLVLPFADDNNHTVLFERVNNFATVFGRTKQAEIATLCRDIVTKVTPHLKELADYTVTPEMLQDINNLIDAYDGKVPKTRSQTKERGVNTKERDALFVKMDTLMRDKILKAAAGFKKTDLDFYSRIIATTTVDETQTPPTVLRIHFKDAKGKRVKHANTARVDGSETVHTQNDKGDIIIKFDKGGRKDILIPVEGGEPMLFKGLLLKKGKTKTLRVTI